MNFKPPPYISNSQLQAFKKSPQHWIHYLTTPKEPTDQMILGSIAHCLALEKDKFKDKYFLMDVKQRPEKDKNFTSTENKKWKAEQLEKAGKLELVTNEQYDEAQNMVTALLEDPVARHFIEGDKESRLEWSSLGLKFLGIRDISSPEYINDLKFVTNADPRAFHNYLFREGVFRQGGMYLDGEMNGEFTGDPHKRVLYTAVENKAPYGVSVHELDYEVINFAVNEYRSLANQLKICIDGEYYPSYSFRSIDGRFDVTLPTFIPTE